MLSPDIKRKMFLQKIQSIGQPSTVSSAMQMDIRQNHV